MPPSANFLVRGILGAIGVCGAGIGGAYAYRAYCNPHPARDEKLVRLAAIALSSEVINKSLHDKEVLAQLRVFGMQVLTHPVVVAHLKQFFKEELTGDTLTRAALRKFIVKDVIQDAWVREELIDVVGDLVRSVQANPDLFPERILAWLGGAALEGMQQEAFRQAVCCQLKRASWIALLGPPPLDMGVE